MFNCGLSVFNKRILLLLLLLRHFAHNSPDAWMHVSILLRSCHHVSELVVSELICQRKVEEATVVWHFSIPRIPTTVRADGAVKAGRQSSHLAHRSLMSHRCLFAPIFASRHTTSNVCADAQWQLDYGTRRPEMRRGRMRQLWFSFAATPVLGRIRRRSSAASTHSGGLVFCPSDVAKPICIDDDHWHRSAGHLSHQTCVNPALSTAFRQREFPTSSHLHFMVL